MIENGQRTQLIQDLTFELKGEFYPEQYNVFDENNQEIAYVRLRHGELYVSEPDLNEHWRNTNNWETDFPKDRRLKGDGFFDDDEERTFFLNFIAKIIHKKLQNPIWEAWQENGLYQQFLNS